MPELYSRESKFVNPQFLRLGFPGFSGVSKGFAAAGGFSEELDGRG
jgi:hypothetical protein